MHQIGVFVNVQWAGVGVPWFLFSARVEENCPVSVYEIKSKSIRTEYAGHITLHNTSGRYSLVGGGGGGGSA